ncbi:MAG TPA: hypothetical protein VFV79_07510, partial [Saprospiraceae bacterium]|nr:hypothetical protein [Saprospiraceae bacterium]
MQISKTRSLLPLLMMVIISACVKDPQDIPPNVTSDPEFGMSAQFGNQAVDIDAGIGGWTIVPVVNQVDSFKVYTAVIGQDGCTDQCLSSWTFNFYQEKTNSLSEKDKFLNTVKEGPVDFVISDAERDSFIVSIATHPDLFMNGVSYWEDPGSSNFIYTSEFAQNVGTNETFGACFQSIIYAGCQYNQCVYFKPATMVPCIAR